MKRVLAGLAIGAAALVAVPAHASESVPITVTPTVNDTTIGVGTAYGNQPLVVVYVHPQSHSACAGFSYQVPFCVGGPNPILP